MWFVYKFDEKTHSYCCKLGFKQCCVKQTDIVDYRPLYGLKCKNPACSYLHIRLRHVLCFDN